MKFVSVAVLAVLCACLAVASAQSAPTSAQKLLIPTYFYPGELWTRTIIASPRGSIVIANPFNGPGTAFDAQYAATIKEAQDQGLIVIGYVHTLYGERASATVKADITRFYDWYHVDGIFFDECPSTATKVAYMADLVSHTREQSSASLTVFNNGIYPDQGYFDAGDIIITIENSASAFKRLVTPSWIFNYPKEKIAHIVHTTAATDLLEIMALSRQRNAGFIYVTDDNGSNPPTTFHLSSPTRSPSCHLRAAAAVATSSRRPFRWSRPQHRCR